jgi:hypothetical protein
MALPEVGGNFSAKYSYKITSALTTVEVTVPIIETDFTLRLIFAVSKPLLAFSLFSQTLASHSSSETIFSLYIPLPIAQAHAT